uniref:Gene 1 ring forming protein domain-containing protein n=1 Tax=Mycobacterium phage Pharb TaxID=3136626 RepID=A0AAU8GSG7_9VIRU
MFDPEVAPERVRVLGLALQCHLQGHQNEGATVIETAEIFREFVEQA